MKNIKVAAVVVTMMAMFAGEASAKGCLTGAAVGGAAGHFAGHHSLIGAGVGCAIGRHRANKKDKEAAASVAANQQRSPTVQPTTDQSRPVRTK